MCFPVFRILIRRSKNGFKVLFVSSGVDFAIVSSMEVIKPVVFENISLNVELTSQIWQFLEYSECREVDTNIKVKIYPFIQIINPTKCKIRDLDFAGWKKTWCFVDRRFCVSKSISIRETSGYFGLSELGCMKQN